MNWLACKQMKQHRRKSSIKETVDVRNVEEDGFPGLIVSMAFESFPVSM